LIDITNILVSGAVVILIVALCIFVRSILAKYEIKLKQNLSFSIKDELIEIEAVYGKNLEVWYYDLVMDIRVIFYTGPVSYEFFHDIKEAKKVGQPKCEEYILVYTNFCVAPDSGEFVTIYDPDSFERYFDCIEVVEYQTFIDRIHKTLAKEEDDKLATEYRQVLDYLTHEEEADH